MTRWTKPHSLKYWRAFLLLTLAMLSCACICCPWFDPRALLISDDHPNPQVERLKSYVPAETLPTVNPDYFTYFGFRDWWRWPLVYPYSLHAVDTLDSGALMDERAVTDYDDINNQDLGSLNLYGITHLIFDRRTLLLRREWEDTTDVIHVEYILFDFSTAEETVFDSEAALFEAAKAANFEGDLVWMTLREYDALFWPESP